MSTRITTFMICLKTTIRIIMFQNFSHQGHLYHHDHLDVPTTPTHDHTSIFMIIRNFTIVLFIFMSMMDVEEYFVDLKNVFMSAFMLTMILMTILWIWMLLLTNCPSPSRLAVALLGRPVPPFWPQTHQRRFPNLNDRACRAILRFSAENRCVCQILVFLALRNRMSMHAQSYHTKGMCSLKNFR